MEKDQHDYVAENEKLTKDLKASSELASSEAARANTEKTRADAEKARADKAEAELKTQKEATQASEKRATEAEAKAATVESKNKELELKMVDFNKSVACEVARLGIQHEAIEKPVTTSGKRMTATEKLFALKGVKTIDELQAKSAETK